MLANHAHLVQMRGVYWRILSVTAQSKMYINLFPSELLNYGKQLCALSISFIKLGRMFFLLFLTAPFPLSSISVHHCAAGRSDPAELPVPGGAEPLQGAAL